MRDLVLGVAVVLGAGCSSHAQVVQQGVAPEAVATSSVARPERPVPYPVVPDADYRAAVEAGTRSPTGAPGAGYWQQWADYRIEASLDPENKRLDGQATITYHNRSPRTLSVVFLHLLQNLHAPGVPRNRPVEMTGGVELTSVTAGGQALSEGQLRRGPGYQVQGTILAIRPPTPLRSGDSLTLEIGWGFKAPQSGRMGWNGDNLVYMAYWYPQMAVYDDVVGWQLDSYLGTAEFYMGYGDYDVTIDAPEGWVIMGTGTLQNRAAVLPAPVLERLARAERSDDVVAVLTEADFGPGRATLTSATGRLRWHFTAENVRDMAFSATRESRWDAARTTVGDRDGDGRPDYTRVDAFWRSSASRWQHSARYTQHAIDFLSRYTGVPYPWPHMTAVEGGGIIGGGMEFPMMTLIGDYTASGDSALYYVTAHEEAHMWLPMLVGVDEKRYSWMDEGSTSFHENQASKEFYPGRDWDEGDRTAYLSQARRGTEGEMMRWSDYQYQGAFGVASYSKPASALVALRRYLGEDRFLDAWRTYLRTWAFKHPKPWDFFNTMETVSGEDLDWFWHSWYYETWTLDQAVDAVDDIPGGARITVVDRGYLPMPAYVTVTFDDGAVENREVSVEHWLAGRRRATLDVMSNRPVVKVEIDATRALPDIDRDNNVWTRGDRS